MKASQTLAFLISSDMTPWPASELHRSEQQVRTDLAAAYRLAALAGWDDTIYTHLSAAVPGEPGVYLINEFGLCFDEVTASNLVKVNLQGEVVDGSGRRVNPTGFTVHGAVHAARPEVACVIHLHAPWGVALSMLPQGLLPTSQWAMRLHRRLGRHAYEGLALGADEIAGEQQLERAAEVGIVGVVQVGTDLATSKWSAEIAASEPRILAAVALHPNDAPEVAARGELHEQLAQIDELASWPRTRAACASASTARANGCTARWAMPWPM